MAFPHSSRAEEMIQYRDVPAAEPPETARSMTAGQVTSRRGRSPFTGSLGGHRSSDGPEELTDRGALETRHGDTC